MQYEWDTVYLVPLLGSVILILDHTAVTSLIKIRPYYFEDQQCYEYFQSATASLAPALGPVIFILDYFPITFLCFTLFSRVHTFLFFFSVTLFFPNFFGIIGIEYVSSILHCTEKLQI